MKKIANITEKISFILFCILMIDCSFMGFAAWGQFGPVASRMFVMLLSLLFAIPSLLLGWKKILNNKYLINIILFAVVIVIATVVGIVNGNNMSLVITDIKGFSTFLILPVAIHLLNSKERIYCVMKCMMIGTTALAIHSVVTLIIYLTDKSLFLDMAIEYSKISFAYYGAVTETIPRMFYQSSMYFLCGCAFAVYFFVKSKSKNKWLYLLVIGICLFATILTYTRSIYLGAFVAAILLLVFLWMISSKEERKKFYLCVVGAVVSFALFLGVFGAVTKTNYLRFAILRTTSGIIADSSSGDDFDEDLFGDEVSDGEVAYLEQTVTSDNIREETLKGLYRNIKKNPVTGIGLGAAFKERPDGRNEYVYLDMISKMGVIGLLVYLMPIIIMTFQLFKIRKKITVEYSFPVLSYFLLLGFMVTSFFNPYMNGALGIFFYCFVMANISWLNSEMNEGK